VLDRAPARADATSIATAGRRWGWIIKAALSLGQAVERSLGGTDN